MNTLPIQMQTIYRPAAEESDDDLGRDVVALVRNALSRGSAPGSALVIRNGRLDIIPMGPLVQKKVHIGAFLAGLSRSELTDSGVVLAVGVMGRFRWRYTPEKPQVPVVMVFIEWPDGRWWHWRAVIDQDNQSIREDTATMHRAEDGLPKPRSLGGWWSLGRRRNLRVKLAPRKKEGPKAVGPVQ